MVEWLKASAALAALFLTLAGILISLAHLAWSARGYVKAREAEVRQQRYKNYHELIERIVGAVTAGAFLDVQIAAVFELRNYPEYGAVSGRILRGLLATWEGKPQLARLRAEIDLTLVSLRQ